MSACGGDDASGGGGGDSGITGGASGSGGTGAASGSGGAGGNGGSGGAAGSGGVSGSGGAGGSAGAAGGDASTTGGAGGGDASASGGSAGSAGASGAGGSAGADAGPCAAPAIGPEVVTSGAPSWTIQSWAVYVAPIGTPASGGAESITSMKAVWGPNHAWDAAKNVFKSAVAHAPPYDGELLPGVAAAGFKNTGCVLASDFIAPSGVIISALLTPSANAITAPTFEVPAPGPAIAPGDLNVNGDLYRDGVLIDPYFDTSYPKAGFVYDYQPPFDVSAGGFKHLIMNWSENDAFAFGATLSAGSYEFKVMISDLSGNGTSHSVKFVVN